MSSGDPDCFPEAQSSHLQNGNYNVSDKEKSYDEEDNVSMVDFLKNIYLFGCTVCFILAVLGIYLFNWLY